MKYKAYWIKNTHIIPVPILHINVVIEHPEHFNYTTEQIKSIYEKHNEPYGHEGKAREEIMLNLIKNKGWIRVRYTVKNDTWTVELDKLGRKNKDTLWQFFTLLTGTNLETQSAIDTVSKYSDIKLYEVSNVKIPHSLNIQDCLQFKGLFEGKEDVLTMKLSDITSTPTYKFINILNSITNRKS